METQFFLLGAIVILVAAFDFTNGFHDAADMVATAIASQAMKSSTAIAIVSFFTFIGPLSVGLAVADTVGTFIDMSNVTLIAAQSLVIGALLSAITFNLITWKIGHPSSSSNALAGGLIGAGLYIVGSSHISWGIDALSLGKLEGVMKVVAGLFASPILGFIIGYLTMKLLMLLFRRFTTKIRSIFIATQYLSVAMLGFSHGANDAQKGMAIIGMMLLATGHTDTFSIPLWAILVCTTAITAGTMFGGWSIIKTLGFDLYRIRILHSVANQTGSALVNSVATAIGAPTSTTQVVTATLLGNGAAEKPAHVNWKKAFQIIGGWFLNIPVSMVLGAGYASLFLYLMGG